MHKLKRNTWASKRGLLKDGDRHPGKLITLSCDVFLFCWSCTHQTCLLSRAVFLKPCWVSS